MVSKAVGTAVSYTGSSKEAKTLCGGSKGDHCRYQKALGGGQSGKGNGQAISRNENLPEEGCVGAAAKRAGRPGQDQALALPVTQGVVFVGIPWRGTLGYSQFRGHHREAPSVPRIPAALPSGLPTFATNTAAAGTICFGMRLINVECSTFYIFAI